MISLSSVQAPASPAATRNALKKKKSFCFQVADPTSSTAVPAPSTADHRAPEEQQEERFSTILQTLDSLSEKIENLSDMLLGV